MMRKTKIYALVLLGIFVFTASVQAADDPPDITGLWYGTWERSESIEWTGRFSVTFWDSGAGLMAKLYAPAFGLFDVDVPVAIEGSAVTIGYEGVSVMRGVLDGQSLSGTFLATVAGPPPTVLTGTWYAEKFVPQDMSPDAAPGPACDDLPPLYCRGDAEYCSELVLFEPSLGEGYFVERNAPAELPGDRPFGYIRRDLMMLVKYATAKVACKSADWEYGNLGPLGLLDMSDQDGSTPTDPDGSLRHPAGTHEAGKDIDTAYYQLYATGNLARAVGVHHDGFDDAYHLVGPPYALDKWRTALYVAYLTEHPRFRVIGVDGQVGLVLEEALDDLVELGWLDADARASIPLAYEVELPPTGPAWWYYFHHHHAHLSISPLGDLVSSAELEPQVLGRGSSSRTITSHIELDEGFDVSLIDVSSIALILNGHTMLYAQPQDMRISDYNDNGIADLTVEFDRQRVLHSVENGYVDISITGLADGQFFQASDTIHVLGAPASEPMVSPGGDGSGK